MTAVRYRVLPHGEGLPAPSYRSDLAAGLDLAAAIEEGDGAEPRARRARACANRHGA